MTLLGTRSCANLVRATKPSAPAKQSGGLPAIPGLLLTCQPLITKGHVMQRTKLLKQHHREPKPSSFIKSRRSSALQEEPIDQSYILPCSVTLENHTTIQKGCELGTLLDALRARSHP